MLSFQSRSILRQEVKSILSGFPPAEIVYIPHRELITSKLLLTFGADMLSEDSDQSDQNVYWAHFG